MRAPPAVRVASCSPSRVLVHDRVAEAALGAEHPSLQQMDVVLPGEGDAAEDLQRGLDHRTGGARTVGLGDARTASALLGSSSSRAAAA